MTIRYEANPPKILPDRDTGESIARFVDRIRRISGRCDSIHLTENVLGHRRVPPLDIAGILRDEIPDTPITTSLRVRDKSESQVIDFARRCIKMNLSGILVLMGDPQKYGTADSGLVPSRVVKKLKQLGIDSDIDLYLSIPSRPDLSKISAKIEAGPRGFMTQVVQTIDQVRYMHENLPGHSIIPIILFPSERNRGSAEFLDIDLDAYKGRFEDLARTSHDMTGDILLTSPNDFAGIHEFLSGFGDQSTKYAASG